MKPVIQSEDFTVPPSEKSSLAVNWLDMIYQNWLTLLTLTVDKKKLQSPLQSEDILKTFWHLYWQIEFVFVWSTSNCHHVNPHVSAVVKWKLLIRIILDSNSRCLCKGVQMTIVADHLDNAGFNTTGVKLCTFHWLISNGIAQKERVLNGLISHHSIMITCISYEIIFTISLPKLIYQYCSTLSLHNPCYRFQQTL